MYKQAIVIRSDLGMSSGKVAAQVAHASIKAWKKASSRMRSNWERDGSTKVVLEASSKEALLELKRHAEELGVAAALIRDAGRTEVEPGTLTCLAVGPDADERVDSVTGDLKLVD